MHEHQTNSFRASPKKNLIASEMRQLITSGRLGPGDRLPTRKELNLRFRGSMATIQAALEELSSQGFVEPHGRGGTRVVNHPPHLSQYGFVLQSAPSDK